MRLESSLDQEDPLEEKVQPTLVFLHGEFHAQRSLSSVCGITKSWIGLIK